MTAPLMPKATAVWLVENTTLTFRQIAKFCELHELEVQAIADGDVAFNIIGISPIDTNQLTPEEIARCEKDKMTDLVAIPLERNVKAKNVKAKKILSPSQRSDKPAAILWILKNMPEIIDSQICKLVGTTKQTINNIRTGKYKDMANLRPKNPVAIGLCSEKDLEKALTISNIHNAPKPEKKKKKKAKKAKKVSVKKTSAKKTAPKKKPAAKKKAVAKKSTKKIVKKAVKKAIKKDGKKLIKKAEIKKIARKVKAKKTASKAVKKAALKTIRKTAPKPVKKPVKKITKTTKKLARKK